MILAISWWSQAFHFVCIVIFISGWAGLIYGLYTIWEGLLIEDFDSRSQSIKKWKREIIDLIQKKERKDIADKSKEEKDYMLIRMENDFIVDLRLSEEENWRNYLKDREEIEELELELTKRRAGFTEITLFAKAVFLVLLLCVFLFFGYMKDLFANYWSQSLLISGAILIVFMVSHYQISFKKRRKIRQEIADIFDQHSAHINTFKQEKKIEQKKAELKAKLSGAKDQMVRLDRADLHYNEGVRMRYDAISKKIKCIENDLLVAENELKKIKDKKTLLLFDKILIRESEAEIKEKADMEDDSLPLEVQEELERLKVEDRELKVLTITEWYKRRLD